VATAWTVAGHAFKPTKIWSDSTTKGICNAIQWVSVMSKRKHHMPMSDNPSTSEALRANNSGVQTPTRYLLTALNMHLTSRQGMKKHRKGAAH